MLKQNSQTVKQSATRIVGHAIVEQLVAAGIDKVFGVPGESYLDVLDGLYEYQDHIRTVVTRQEGGAAMMAAATGRATGKPGVCFVTRGPGATNASIGVHVAAQDASPMVLFIGQVPQTVVGQIAFQEVDYKAMFGTIAKEVLEINHADRAIEIVSRALRVAVSGEPGPVVVVLPEDVLLEQTNVPAQQSMPTHQASPTAENIEQVIQELNRAQRPLVVVGRQIWKQDDVDRLHKFVEGSSIPTVTTVRSQDIINNDSPSYVGTLGLHTTPGLEQRVAEADVVVLLGTRPDALSLDHCDLGSFDGNERTLIHVYPDADVIGRIYPTNIGIVSTTHEFLKALPQTVDSSLDRSDWATEMRTTYLKTQRELAQDNSLASAYMNVFNAYVGSEAVLTVGAGNYTAWAQRYRTFNHMHTQFGTESGAMGYGVPAGIAAALAFPNKKVVTFAGDGCFLMNGQELSTIHRYDLDVLLVIVNNEEYGTIHDHQERRYPGRQVGTALENPDFSLLAQAYGAQSRAVTSPAEFDEALRTLWQETGLRCIEIRTYDNHIN